MLLACACSNGATRTPSDGASVDAAAADVAPDVGAEAGLPPIGTPNGRWLTGASCNVLAPGARVPVRMLDNIPAFTGGVIQEGFYDAISDALTSSFAGPAATTLLLTGNRFSRVRLSFVRPDYPDFPETEERSNGTYAVSQNQLTLTGDCGLTKPVTYSFSATAQELVLRSQNGVTRFQRRNTPAAPPETTMPSPAAVANEQRRVRRVTGARCTDLSLGPTVVAGPLMGVPEKTAQPIPQGIYEAVAYEINPRTSSISDAAPSL